MVESAPRGIPGVDENGLAALLDLRERARRSRPDELSRLYVVPGLVLLARPLVVRAAPHEAGSGGASDIEALERSFRQTWSDDTAEWRANRTTASAWYHDRVAFLTKRPGNPFPQLVSVGRALNNDIVIALETISKIHGYFLRDGERWSYTDHRSKNGTLVNGRRLGEGERRPLAEGDHLDLGREVTAVFLPPRALVARLSAGS